MQSAIHGSAAFVFHASDWQDLAKMSIRHVRIFSRDYISTRLPVCTVQIVMNIFPR